MTWRFIVLVILLFGFRPCAAADLPAAWVQFGSSGNLEVRKIIPPGAACPQILADGKPTPTSLRGEPNSAYPLPVCTVQLPLNTRNLTVDGLPAPVVPKAINRIVIVGDTGCRLKGSFVQDCNDPAAWPFDSVARLAASRHPDLVIHVGDYHYRESPCPQKRPGCAGSPYGDKWEAWKADFFDPAAPLLAVAPWVMVRGNHELCNRGGNGWFRLLDPHPGTACVPATEPYALSVGRLHLLVLDSAAADDDVPDAGQVAAYRRQFEALQAKIDPKWPAGPIWLLTHRPIWSLAQGEGVKVGSVTNINEQAAMRGLDFKRLDMIVSGHIHDFAAYDFGGARPAQLVAGESGDAKDETIQTPKAGLEIDGVAVRRAITLAKYGFTVLEREGRGWRGSVVGIDDRLLARCRVESRMVSCQETIEPALER